MQPTPIVLRRRPADDSMYSMSLRPDLESEPMQSFLRNGMSGRWRVARGVVVALTLSGHYFAGRAIIEKIVVRDLIVVRVQVVEVSDAMVMNIPFPENSVTKLSECMGHSILWDAADLRPYAEVNEDYMETVGGQPTVSEDVKPVQKFLELQEGMQVALSEGCEDLKRCAGIGIIFECSPKGTWKGFLVPHSFFVVVRVLSVNSKFCNHPAYCEIPEIEILGDSVGRLILWSGYSVCPLTTNFNILQKTQNRNFSTPDSEQVADLDLGDDSASKSSDDFASSESEAEEPVFDTQMNSVPIAERSTGCHADVYPDRPEWRNKYCLLLNEDLFFFGRALIQVCLPIEACDEMVLGDTDVGVLFVSDNPDLQMTTMRWPLTHTRLEDGLLLSECVTYCSENCTLADDECSQEGVPKDPYRGVRRKLRHTDGVASNKMRRITQPENCRLVSSMKCCNERCCQTFNWEDTLKIRRNYYSRSFEQRREVAYTVQDQLHTVPTRRKLYITLANVDVCEVAWYVIHGVSKSAYHNYKADAKGGRVNGFHGNNGVLRPRNHTVQARGTISTIINENADQMPNEFRVIGKQRVAALKVLPSTMNWNHLRDMANVVNKECHAKPISQSAVSKLKRKYFRNVEVKSVGSNFLVCTECNFLVEFIAKYPRGSDEWQSLTEDRQRHLNYQRACRNVYYGWRAQSIEYPTEFLCILHDKMDTTKTAIPRMQRITKATADLGQIPISCIGMLTHGHGDGAYAHYSTLLWPGDSNFTISSLCRVLRALERLPVRETKELLRTPPQNSFFEALLHGKSRCSASIPQSKGDPVPCTILRCPQVPLPRKLFLQLDNSAKDNKNRFVMAFLSLLTARRVFKEVTVGFLIVGHTHEDIDAHFSYLSKLIKRKNTYCLADLMKAFMDSQKTIAFIPEFVQEVADFKSYLADFHHHGNNKLVGLGDMHLFKFYVEEEGEDVGWPVIRYKKRATDASWLLPRKPIKMWTADNEGNPRLPQGDPKPVPFKPLWGDANINTRKRNINKELIRAAGVSEKKSFITTGIAKFIEFWKFGMSRDKRYAQDMSPYVSYWERIHQLISGSLPPLVESLQEGFWPATDWSRDHARRSNPQTDPHNDPDKTPEDQPDPYPFCGPQKSRPKLLFNPYRDVLLGDFVLCRPSDESDLPIWMGRVLECVDLSPGKNYGKFKIEWWTPMKGKREGKKVVARDCWTRRWEKESSLSEIVHCDIVLYSHRYPSHHKSGPPKTHRIPEDAAAAAMASLESNGVSVNWDEPDSD